LAHSGIGTQKACRWCLYSVPLVQWYCLRAVHHDFRLLDPKLLVQRAISRSSSSREPRCHPRSVSVFLTFARCGVPSAVPPYATISPPTSPVQEVDVSRQSRLRPPSPVPAVPTVLRCLFSHGSVESRISLTCHLEAIQALGFVGVTAALVACSLRPQ
jgi:hypothetical protein